VFFMVWIYIDIKNNIYIYIYNYFNIFLNENHFQKVLCTTLQLFNKKANNLEKKSLEKKIEEKDKKSFFYQLLKIYFL
jgi:hypothetical protein